MNLHEYQAKEIFKNYSLPVSPGIAVKSTQEAVDAAQKLGGSKWVIKCQVHAGGRGKAGGVALVSSLDEIKDFANKWLGKNIVTFQTDKNGQPVNTLYVETLTNIKKELYLGAVIDRSTRRVVFMASTEGGVEIEEVAHNTPEKIHTVEIDPLAGALPFQGRKLAFALGLDKKLVGQFTKLFLGLGKMFIEKDLALLEINPLVITDEDNIHCLDAKVSIDSNAAYRQAQIAKSIDMTQEDAREAKASSFDLNYVALDGNIGCMVNGAGLAMGTMDIIKHHGGDPANFLDVGGGATKERVTEAFKIILSDTNVKAVLVNIFGGIVRCDLIADGILGAVAEVGVKVPVVVRLEGNNAKLGNEILAKSDFNIIASTSLTNAATSVVAAAKGE